MVLLAFTSYHNNVNYLTVTEICQLNDQHINENVPRSPCKKRILASGSELPSIIKVELSHDKRYVVTVTVPDKNIRVFSLDGDGHFQMLSERSRICSRAIDIL